MTLTLLEICLVDSQILEQAFASNLSDFEDAVQEACARRENMDAIVTRDRADFAGSTIPIFSAGELLQNLSE